MFYTYILQSEKDNSFYIGSTSDLRKRFAEHNNGKSHYSKHLRPWKLIYYEAFTVNSLAISREFALKKRAKSFQELLKRLGLKR